MTSETERLAALSCSYRNDALPADVRRVATLCVVDHLGCAVRGAGEPLTRMIAEELFDSAVDGAAFLPQRRPASALSNWAMLQGAAAHAIDFDDTFFRARAAHTGAPVVGAALTLGGHLGSSGAALTEAVVAGYETAARLGELLSDAHYDDGFHPTGTVAVFAAAAACCRLMALSETQTQAAFGLAATQAAGLKSTFGTMAKPFNAGKAASNGLLAARLAARGFSAPLDGLEVSKGYLDLYLGRRPGERRIDGPERFAILDNAFKLHAACHWLHPMIEALLRLKARYAPTPESVARVEVFAAPIALKTARIESPATGLECKFSFPQTAAAVLAGRDTASDATYSDAILSDPTINALRSRVIVKEAPISPFETTVVLETHAGEKRRESVNLNDLMANLDHLGAQIEAKFARLTAPILGEGRASRALERLRGLGEIENVAAVF